MRALFADYNRPLAAAHGDDRMRRRVDLPGGCPIGYLTLDFPP
jgi:hypothetical protein